VIRGEGDVIVARVDADFDIDDIGPASDSPDALR
jgi:hypothetical protein